MGKKSFCSANNLGEKLNMMGLGGSGNSCRRTWWQLLCSHKAAYGLKGKTRALANQPACFPKAMQ